jgi:hypothetical protein
MGASSFVFFRVDKVPTPHKTDRHRSYPRQRQSGRIDHRPGLEAWAVAVEIIQISRHFHRAQTGFLDRRRFLRGWALVVEGVWVA